MMTLLIVLATAAEAYLLGSIDTGILVSKYLYHDDVRNYGSGAAGMTNMLRTFGKKAAALTAFGDVLKGALAVRAREITEGMKIRAARALAALVTDEQLSADYILPSALDKSVADTVAHAVAQEAREQGIARA